MKIAVAAQGEYVTEHFGHCPIFSIYETEESKVVKKENIDNPGHRPGFLPNFLADLGVNVIISGGMGGGAVDIFTKRNIEVITGASGLSDDLVAMYLEGKLKSTGSICHQHQHQHECGNH